MILQIDHASISYEPGTPIIRDLNFSAQSGDLIAILGPNGAGKTTLLRCLMGFLRWKEGHCRIDGTDIRTIPQHKLWQIISYVPQARGAFASLKAEDMILLGRTGKLGLFSTPSAKDRAKVGELADLLGISRSLLQKHCNEMSGGELQMIRIARALAAEPSLLILDEPESNLDFKNQLIVLDALSKLSAQGSCCIFNTHYPEHALTRANKSLILQKGGQTIFGDTSNVVTESNLERAFGVKSIIREVETEGNIYRSILPLSLSGARGNLTESEEERPLIGVVSLIVPDMELGTRINQILHQYRDQIIGRMGMSYAEGGVHIIHVTLDAPKKEIDALTHQLNILPGVRVKATLSEKGDSAIVQDKS